MKNILKKLNACNQSIEWVQNKTIEQAINECERGDWMVWLFKKLLPNELKLLTLAKGHCANTVRHLMTDERSLKAIDTAIAFGEGKATREELDAAADAAYTAAVAYAASASAAADTAYAAADTAYAAAAVAYAYAYAYASADADARKANQLQTANICRNYLGGKLIEACKQC